MRLAPTSFCAALVAFALAACDSPDKTIHFTADELYSEYRADRTLAQRNYANDLLVVTGKTWGVAPTPPYRIVVETSDETGKILVAIDKAAAEAAGIDKKFARIKVACRWRKQDTSAKDIGLSECKVVK